MAALLGAALGTGRPCHASRSAQEVLKIGVVYVSPIAEIGWTKQHSLGVEAIKAAFGDKVELTVIDNIFMPQDAERVFRELAASGNKLIFGTSFSHGTPMQKVAPRFPDVAFEHCSGIVHLPNLGTFEAKYYEGTFVAGAAAGHMSKAGKIGFIGGFPIPDIVGPANALLLGAQSVNPAATCNAIFLNSWFDPGKEKEAANTLVSQGCDVICSMTDTATGVQVAGEHGAWSIGYASDMAKFGAGKQLTAFMLDWTSDYVSAGQGASPPATGSRRCAGTGWPPAWSRWRPTTRPIPADVQAKLKQLEADIGGGKVHPYAGELKDQDGNVKVAAGSVLADADIRGMNWFVDGMIGKLGLSASISRRRRASERPLALPAALRPTSLTLRQDLRRDDPAARAAQHLQALSGRRRQRRHLAVDPAGRDPRGAGRERRRQVDADEDHLRRGAGRCRRDLLGRQADRSAQPGACRARSASGWSSSISRCSRPSPSPRTSRSRSTARFDLARARRRRSASCRSATACRSIPHRRVHDLSVGERQRVEIVRCLLQEPQLLIMDEPTSVLTPQAVEKLFETLRQLAAEGCSILYISHKLDEIRALCDTATVLRGGKVTGTATAEADDVARACPHDDRREAARDASSSPSVPQRRAGRSNVRGLSLPREDPFGIDLDDVSFDVHARRDRRHRRRLRQRPAGADRAAQRRTAAHRRTTRSGSAAQPVGRLDPRAPASARPGLRARGAARPRRGAAHSARRERRCSPPIAWAWSATAWSTERKAARVRQRRHRSSSTSRPAARRRRAQACPAATCRSSSSAARSRCSRSCCSSRSRPGASTSARPRTSARRCSTCAQGRRVLVVSEELDELFEICDRLLVIARAASPRR